MKLLSLILLSVAANQGLSKEERQALKAGKAQRKAERKALIQKQIEVPAQVVVAARPVVVAPVRTAAARAAPAAARAAPAAAPAAAAAVQPATDDAPAAAVQSATDDAPANLSSEKEAEPETAQAVSTAPTQATSVGTVVGFVLVAGLIMSVIGFVTVKKLIGEKEEDTFAPPKQREDIGYAYSREMPPGRQFEVATVDFPAEKRSVRDSTISNDSLFDAPSNRSNAVAGDSGLMSMLNKV
jgi:hypothetical protein